MNKTKMQIKRIILMLITIFSAIMIQGQIIKSEKAFVQVKSKPKIITNGQPDNTPPELKILSPAIYSDFKYKCNVPEINFIGKVKDESGIASVIVNSKILDTSDAGLFSTILQLKPGDNEISVIIMDKKDNILDTRIIIEYSLPVVTLADRVAQKGKYYGLIIGINNYEDPSIPNLDNPIKDAQKLFDVLISNYTFSKENVLLVKDPKRADIINSLEYYARKITDNDNLLIFFAGHGWWDEVANNGYWLPSDAQKNIKTDWIRNSTLVDYLNEIRSKHTLLITDACFGGAIFKTRTLNNDVPSAMEKLYDLPSRKVMTSGTLTEVPDRSIFVKFLIERLEGNNEKYLSSEQLFSSFRIAVINNSDAIPQYGEIRNVGDQGGDFIFIRK
jgi:Caspase domain